MDCKHTISLLNFRQSGDEWQQVLARSHPKFYSYSSKSLQSFSGFLGFGLFFCSFGCFFCCCCCLFHLVFLVGFCLFCFFNFGFFQQDDLFDIPLMHVSYSLFLFTVRLLEGHTPTVTLGFFFLAT